MDSTNTIVEPYSQGTSFCAHLYIRKIDKYIYNKLNSKTSVRRYLIPLALHHAPHLLAATGTVYGTGTRFTHQMKQVYKG